MLYFLPSHDEVTLLYQIKDSRTGFKPAKEITEPFIRPPDIEFY